MSARDHTAFWQAGMGLRAAFSLALVSLCSAPVFAQEPGDDEIFDRGCGDDNGTDRCDAQIQRKMRDLYDWDSASELIDQGVQFRRFMMVDGYGRDVLGLTFERRPGASSRLIVDVPYHKDGSGQNSEPQTSPLVANLSAEQWQSAIALTEGFDGETPEDAVEDNDPDVLIICLHSWFTVMDAGDPVQEPQIRSKAHNSCNKGKAMGAAFALSKMARAALPECSPLDPDNYRNEVMLLAHCKRLGGDRMVAAEAAVMMEDVEKALDSGFDDGLTRFFDPEDEALALALANRLIEVSVYWGAPHATGPDNAFVLATVSAEIQPPDEEKAYSFHDLRLELKRDSKGWRIASYQISDSQTVSYNN